MLSPGHPEIHQNCLGLARDHSRSLYAQAESLGYSELVEWLSDSDRACRVMADAAYELWLKVHETDLWADEPFSRVEHQGVLLRTLADAAVREVYGEGSLDERHDFQVAVLSANEMTVDECKTEIDSEVSAQAAAISVLTLPTESMTQAFRTLEDCTGMPWHFHAGSGNLDFGAITEMPGEYRCRLECEGAARLLCSVINGVGRSKRAEEKLATLIRSEGSKGQEVVEVSITGDIAEDPRFVDAMQRSPQVASAKQALAKLLFVGHYAIFEHQESAQRQAAGKAGEHAGYEHLVVEKVRLDREGLLAEELARLTRLSCLPPDMLQRGYTLFFEHESVRDLAEGAVRRLAQVLGVDRGDSTWAVKLYSWDRRHELHLPLRWVEGPEFRLALTLNREVREVFRALSFEDRSLMLPLEAAQEDFAAAAKQVLQNRADARVIDAAKSVDTSLTRNLRELLVMSMVDESAPEWRDVNRAMSVVRALSAENLNRFLGEQSLPWLLQEESERLNRLDVLVRTVAAEFQTRGIPLNVYCPSGQFPVSFDSAFHPKIERYLQALDWAVTGVLPDLEG